MELIHIHFDSIYVNHIEGSSGIFVGPNSQNNWESCSKNNAALGTVVGDSNVVAYNINVIHDEDVVDMPVRKESRPSSQKKEKGEGHPDG